jgi:CRISPR-associated protein Cas5d
MEKQMYLVSIEISGPAAMWQRPDSGSAPISYPAPTYSAVKGIFESIARLKSAYINPLRCEICRPVQYHRYTNNYHGPLRKSNQIRGGDPFQLQAIVLADVCYRLYGAVDEASAAPNSTNHLHALQEMFERRVERGQSFRPVCLGWSEFTPTYLGRLRANTAVQENFNETIPSMLHSVFDRPVGGKVAPTFRHNVQIKSGVIEYAC